MFIDGKAEGKGEIWEKKTRTIKPAEWKNGINIEDISK